ncbi:hypothetical protein MN116_004023 [Schistosoma mekongi]|uniref:Uncharacterized protein n=1 Tax=Schistosoma mekongi TaxID=38744 RepID=A0AAE1ZEI5_SCHME|nr:hypothetical protein MN116_004023 [Schistosoma mekongi]
MNMLSLGFLSRPNGSSYMFVRCLLLLVAFYAVDLSEDLKPKKKDDDVRLPTANDKKKIKNNIEQFDDPETVEKFLRNLLEQDPLFPQVTKNKKDLSSDSEAQRDALDSHMKDENSKSADEPVRDSDIYGFSTENIKSVSDENIVKSSHSLPNEHTTSESSVAQRLYEEAMSILETDNPRTSTDRTALELLNEASRQGYTKAREQVAMLKLLGGYNADSFQSAYSAFEELSNEGNPRGQFGLGFLYASGLHVNASIPHALVYLTFSALGGDNFADMALGYRYWTGVGVEEDCEAALTHYHRVAQVVFKEVSERFESGGPTLLGPMIRRARLLDEVDVMGSVDGDLTISEDLFQYYQFMAYKKNVSAMVGLGQLYYYGRHGVEMNHEKAFHYFNLAAESGSAIAMAYLGEMYMVGSSAVPNDSIKALKYLRKSAEENNPIGQTGLALAYLYGRAGLPVKPVTALELFLKAADQGWPEAQLHLGRLFLGNGTHGIKTDYKLALKYFTMASQQGNVLAFYHLAEMHAKGTGVLRSCSTAAELFKNVAERGRWSKLFMSAYSAFRNRRYHEAFVTYQLLAELGYEVAQSNVAFILEEEKATGIPKHEIYKRAFTQWQRSATQGSTSSRVKLGDYYYYGLGTDVNYQKAIQHYRTASDQHHNAQAMFNLGYMHEQGLGLKRDLYLAKRFYDMAAEASIDARVAVCLALIRLSFYFVMEFFCNSSFFQYIGRIFGRSSEEHEKESGVDSSHPSEHMELFMDWDFYAIPFLTGLLLLLIFYIRHRRV